jgi:hypothetical protein
MTHRAAVQSQPTSALRKEYSMINVRFKSFKTNVEAQKQVGTMTP